MKLQGKQYHLPQGAVGRQFVSILAEEVQAVASGTRNSERIFILCTTVLQRVKLIVAGEDIRRLLRKRMELWEGGKYDELIQEAERCDRKLNGPRRKEDGDHKVRIFTRLVMQGRLRDATRWLTERSGGGVLNPYDLQADGSTVLDALKKKHPAQFCPDLSTFEIRESLPMLIEVDVSASHIEKIAHSLKGSAGPSGTNAEQWRSMLLRFGAHSSRLREAVAHLVRTLANGVVEWNQVKAMLARRAVALDKCPGVRPIGVGELLQRICAKTMAFVTGLVLLPSVSPLIADISIQPFDARYDSRRLIADIATYICCRSRSVPLSCSYIQRTNHNSDASVYHQPSRPCRPRLQPRHKVKFLENKLSRCFPGRSLPDLRSDSTEDSTDSLIDESENYLRRSIDSILTGEEPVFVKKGRRPRSHSQPDQVSANGRRAQPFLARAPSDLRIDHWVKVISSDGRLVVGKVRYVGPLPGAAETHVGLILGHGDGGNCSGSFAGTKYFDCDADCGLFVPFKKVVMAWNA
ncbi:hypothetical protein GE061_010712 [Apolygus lucorum]|uniref:CAP-Gly domain-containing protein n=1 Tax=Apolygus lucorum TaxID=248454 RepID=A0A8S9XWT5_APOLU|nr:hypothetical protein GE061_010712 [Apolygus lucorum]